MEHSNNDMLINQSQHRAFPDLATVFIDGLSLEVQMDDLEKTVISVPE